MEHKDHKHEEHVCGCGCEHDSKEHAHHQHEHEHEHEHEHGENCSCGHCGGPISVYTHDMSVIGSFRFETEQSFEQTESLTERCLKQAAEAIEAAGGIIGHIKAVVDSQGNSCMISITDEESNIRRMEANHCEIEGAAIVFHIDLDELKHIIEDSFSMLL